MDKKIILEYSNTKIRSMKKGDLAQALISLKSVCSEIETTSDADKLGIELLSAKEEAAEFKSISENLQIRLVHYKNEVRVLNKKGQLKAATITDLKAQYENMIKELAYERKSWIWKLFN